MRIAIFAHDANPAVDRPIFHKSPHYIETFLSHRVRMIDQHTAILLPTREQAADMRNSKVLAEDWRVRPSGLPNIGYHFVMQLVTT